MREMHDRYGSRGFLAAYNAGPGRYDDYPDRGRPLPVETLAYVAPVLPLLGNDAGAMPILVAEHDAPAWTRAPIFIVRSAGAKLVAGALSGAMSSRTQGDIPVRDLSAITPRSAGLFVAISAAGRKL